ncbi:YoaK family protein [Vibrio hibernica]|uniref:YoaK family protein n=1 Tax=Vibrio hibernica TaxID=2587465 RepID=UPI00188247B9|nr:YoaK family protein [Vibrio hibernica]
MFTKLPKWVEYGAFTLAVIAGVINAVGLLGFQHQAISHLSGTVTLFGTQVVTNLNGSLYLAMIVFSFVVGSAISGFLLSGGSLKLGRHYDSLLLIEGCLLIISAYLLSHSYYYGIYFASMACGLQNALATTYSGAVIRTTHLTGIFTDLGIMLGKVLKGDTFDHRKCVMFLVIIMGFVSGGVIGQYLFSLYNVSALYFPAVTCLMLASTYRGYRLLSK